MRGHRSGVSSSRGRYTRRQLLRWASGGLTGFGTFLIANSMSGTQSALPPRDEVDAEGASVTAAGERADPGEVDLSGPALALLPTDAAQNQRGPAVGRPIMRPAASADAVAGTPPGVSERGVLPAVREVGRADRPPPAEGSGSLSAEPVPAATPDISRIGDSAVGLRSVPIDAADPYPWLPPTDRVLIPSAGIDAKVVTVGVTPDGYMATPAFAVGRFVASTQAGGLGNVVLAAHNDIEGGLFRRLPETPLDADVLLQRGPAVFTYQVRFRTKVWEEGAPPEQRRQNARFLLATRNPVCTLITCVPLWVDTHRWIVRAVLVDADLPGAPWGAALFFGSG